MLIIVSLLLFFLNETTLCRSRVGITIQNNNRIKTIKVMYRYGNFIYFYTELRHPRTILIFEKFFVLLYIHAF